MKQLRYFFNIMMLASVSLFFVEEAAAQRGRPQRPTPQPSRQGVGMTARNLTVSGNIEVVITDRVRQVEIEGSDRYRGSVRIDENRVGLIIRSVSNSSRRVRVLVPPSRWNAIEVSGGATLRWNGYIDADRLNIECRGKSDIRGGITARQISLNISTKSRADFHGRTDEFRVTASGKSQVNCFRFYAGAVRCQAASGAHVDVYAEDSIFADAQSNSTVHYGGRPATVRKSENSGGRVKRK